MLLCSRIQRNLFARQGGRSGRQIDLATAWFDEQAKGKETTAGMEPACNAFPPCRQERVLGEKWENTAPRCEPRKWLDSPEQANQVSHCTEIGTGKNLGVHAATAWIGDDSEGDHRVYLPSSPGIEVCANWDRREAATKYQSSELGVGFAPLPRARKYR